MLTFLAIYATGATLLIPLLLRQSVIYKKSMLEAHAKNEVLSERLIESTDGLISDDDITLYLEHYGIKHLWKQQAKSRIEWTKNRFKYSDTLRTDACERCGLIRRTWVHGLGQSKHRDLAGYYRGASKIILTNESNMGCLSLTESTITKFGLLSFKKTPRPKLLS